MTTATASLPVSRALPTRPGLARYAGLLVAPAVGTYGFNVVTATLPQLSRALGIAPVGQELVVAAYGIPFAALLILGGRIGDRFGRRRTFMIGMSLFAVAALVGATAPGVEVLVAARIVQGLGAALCTPQVLGTIQATADGPGRIRLIALFGAAGGIGAALGQVLGGTIAGVAPLPTGWRLAYAVAAALAVVSVFLGRWAPDSRSPRPAAADVAGTLQLFAGILLLVVPLTFGPALGWPWPLLVMLAAGAALLVLLWFHQNRIERSGRMPLLPPSVLRLLPLRLGLTMAGLFFAGYGAILYVVTRTVEGGLGIGPAETGLMLLPFAVVFAAVSVGVGRIQRRLGDAVLPLGVALQILALIGGAATVVAAWGPQLPFALQPALVPLGVGQALVFSPLTQLVVREIPDAAAGLSGGMFATVQQLALAIGVIAYGAAEHAFALDPRSGLEAGLIGDASLAVVVLALSGLLGLVIRRERRAARSVA